MDTVVSVIPVLCFQRQFRKWMNRGIFFISPEYTAKQQVKAHIPSGEKYPLI